MKNNKIYIYLFVTYVLMQFSGAVFLSPFLNHFEKELGVGTELAEHTAFGWYMFVSFGLATIIFFLLTLPNKRFFEVFTGKRASLQSSVLWGILGFLMVLIGQIIAGYIEMELFGVEQGSENTAFLGEVLRAAPIAIFSIALFAPILEEFLFRRAIFGSLIKRTNFFISAAISSLLFAVIHLELEHILLYAVSGFIFAFLYYKTKRLLTSIIAHLLLNSYVSVIQLNLDKLEKYIQQVINFYS